MQDINKYRQHKASRIIIRKRVHRLHTLTGAIH